MRDSEETLGSEGSMKRDEREVDLFESIDDDHDDHDDDGIIRDPGVNIIPDPNDFPLVLVVGADREIDRASFSSDWTGVTSLTRTSEVIDTTALTTRVAAATTTTTTTTSTSPPESSASSTGVGETWTIVQTPSPPASTLYDHHHLDHHPHPHPHLHLAHKFGLTAHLLLNQTHHSDGWVVGFDDQDDDGVGISDHSFQAYDLFVNAAASTGGEGFGLSDLGCWAGGGGGTISPAPTLLLGPTTGVFNSKSLHNGLNLGLGLGSGLGGQAYGYDDDDDHHHDDRADSFDCLVDYTGMGANQVGWGHVHAQGQGQYGAVGGGGALGLGMEDPYSRYYHHHQGHQSHQSQQGQAQGQGSFHHNQHHTQGPAYSTDSTATATAPTAMTTTPAATGVFRTNVRDKKDWTDITSYAASMFVDGESGAGGGQQRGLHGREQEGGSHQPQQQQQPHQISDSTTTSIAGQGQAPGPFGSFGLTGSGPVGAETGILGGSHFAQAFGVGVGTVQQTDEAAVGTVHEGDVQSGGMYAAASTAQGGFPVAHLSFGPVMGQSPYHHQHQQQQQPQQQVNEGYYYPATVNAGNGAFQPTFAGKVLPAYASVGAVVHAQHPQQQQQQPYQPQPYQSTPPMNQTRTNLIVSPRTRPSRTGNTRTSVEDYHRAMAAQNVGEMQQLLGGTKVAQVHHHQQQQPSAPVKLEDDADQAGAVGSTQTIESLVDELDAEVEAALAAPVQVSRGPVVTGKNKSAASNRLKSHRSKGPYHRSESTDAQSATDRRQKSISASSSLSSSSSSSEGTVISRNVLYEDGKPKIRNPFGGGRGYVPGETPDDPSKRHKCDICGRGFARLFNLKSHAATHDPARKKPFPCPHDSCPRSFSRLHDLERHRQGIHSDGPLMDAKIQGIAPALARAQERIHARETAKANSGRQNASPFADQAD